MLQANSWTPSAANAIYTFVLTLAAVFGVVAKFRKGKTTSSDGVHTTIPSEGLAKRWYDEWAASQAEVKRLEAIIVRKSDNEDRLNRRLSASELERDRLEEKAVQVEQNQSSILGKLDTIVREVERLKQ